MRNLIMMVALLGLGFGFGMACGLPKQQSGYLGLAAVFVLTALGHFAKPAEMQEMIPPVVPARRLIVWLSGFLEVGLAVGLAMLRTGRMTAVIAMAFLIFVTPLNIYSAVHRVGFGGHQRGPVYLWLRLPLQALLIGWLAWFTYGAG